MIKPGSYMLVERRLHLIVAVVPEQRYVLVLENDPTRLRVLSPVEYMLVAESAKETDVPTLGSPAERAEA